MIRTAKPQDFGQITAIYNYFITHTTVTFDEEEIKISEMVSRYEHTQDQLPWLVFEQAGEVVAYAYAVRWKARSAYKYSAESTIYLKDGVQGQGIGSQLYGELIQQIKQLGFRTIIGGVALPNPASIRLHEKFGFKKVAHFSEVGFKFNQPIDVAYWQLHLR